MEKSEVEERGRRMDEPGGVERWESERADMVVLRARRRGRDFMVMREGWF